MNAIVTAFSLGTTAGLAVRYGFLYYNARRYMIASITQRDIEVRAQTEANEKIKEYVAGITARAAVYKVLAVKLLRASGNHIACQPWELGVDDDIQKIHVSINPVTRVADYYLDEGTTKPQ